MHGQPVSAIAPTNDAKLVYVAGAEPKIKLYHMLSNKVIKTLDGHTDEVNDIAITSDGKYMVSGSNDKTARIWDLTTDKQLRILPVNCWKVTTVSISNDNNYVTTGCNDGSVKVWELKTGKLINSIDCIGSIARNVTFGKTNQYILGAFMLRNIADYGLRVFQSKISLTPFNVSLKNNTINADSNKKETLKVPKVSIQTTNKSPIPQKK